ncbi:hypothetical protein DBR47_17400 [Paucibacter sp. KBW04]|uniref:hypothetical protein n=1 Tax=Paucibacter sp. KBW04 TaxID=2153361 RepID=UPI000F578B5D|nr:hypothetical protein [Paucibacter sp. KBW04]RQO56310.1 hypothetical protein DBR47_17400 [Paucibacter sp. KBW04]
MHTVQTPLCEQEGFPIKALFDIGEEPGFLGERSREIASFCLSVWLKLSEDSACESGQDEYFARMRKRRQALAQELARLQQALARSGTHQQAQV